MRQIFQPEPDDADAWWKLLELMHSKDKKLNKGIWPQCERKILVVVLVDTSIEAIAAGSDTDTPGKHGFDEIWLADYTQVDAFGAVDLFAVVHADLKGHFATGNWGQKPYG